jgi:hypothetical protein
VTGSGGRPNSNTYVSGRERQPRFHADHVASRRSQEGRRTYFVTLTDFLRHSVADAIGRSAQLHSYFLAETGRARPPRDVMRHLKFHYRQIAFVLLGAARPPTVFGT